MRDYQQTKVYRAEWNLQRFLDNAVKYENPVIEIDGITLTLPPEAKFGTIESVQAYCDAVTETVEVCLVRVKTHRGKNTANCSHNGVISVPEGEKWAMREIVILHELAHHITGTFYGHREEFALTYIELLGRIMGPEIGLAMRVLYDHEEVKVG